MESPSIEKAYGRLSVQPSSYETAAVVGAT
jgi:hypothetical protein